MTVTGRTVRILLTGALGGAMGANIANGLTIAEDGRAAAVVVVHHDAGPAVRYAAEELSAFLEKVTGAGFKIVKEKQEGIANLLVGPGAAKFADREFTTADLGTDGIIIHTVDNCLILAGGDPRGTLYAVYTFLEDHVGCRWWTASASFVPSKPQLRSGDLDVQYVPQFESRSTNSHGTSDPDFSVRNKLNGHSHRLFASDGFHNVTQDARRGGRAQAHIKSDKWGAHTFWTLVPPEIYAPDHPEWFAEVDGERTRNVQKIKSELRSLCLTNQEVRRTLVDNARLALAWNPHANILSVSQIDGLVPCRCKTCMAVVNEEESFSGLLIRFVNAVSDDLQEYSNIPIETFAYHYTRKPPRFARPGTNVYIRFVVAYDTPESEVFYSTPLDGDVNQRLLNDLRGWSEITSRLYLYYYLPNFMSHFHPFPNLEVMGPNVRLFAELGAKGAFGEAWSRSSGAELAELRAWVWSKLLWNPRLDARALVEEFVHGYYGGAGSEVLAYLGLLEDAAKKTGELLQQGTGNQAHYLSLDTLLDSWKHLAAAEAAVSYNPDVRERVQIAQLPVLYIIMMRWEELRRTAHAEGIRWPLPNSLEDAFHQFEQVALREDITALVTLQMTPAMQACRTVK